MKALNHSSRLTTVGVFIYTENCQIALRTTSFCILDPDEFPEFPILDILTGHYSVSIQTLFSDLKSLSSA